MEKKFGIFGIKFANGKGFGFFCSGCCLQATAAQMEDLIIIFTPHHQPEGLN